MNMAKKTGKVVAAVLISLVWLILMVLTGLNCAKRFIYAEYYSNRKIVAKIPDLNRGFVPQGLGYSEEEKLILQSGYLAGSNCCVIYLTDEDGKSTRIRVLDPDGANYVGHFGGIACSGDFVYVSEDYCTDEVDLSNRLYVFSLQELIAASEEGTIAVGDYLSVDAEGACVSCNDGYLYVGEFYDPGTYETDPSHEVTTPGGKTQNALISAYPLDETKPFGLGELEYQISVPGRVQGFAKIGDVAVISTSWGPLSSHMGYYRVGDTGTTTVSSGKEVPLYYIDETTRFKNLSMPAMSEGIFISDGRVNVYFESAGNKYVFGKFFNACYIVNLPFFQS